MNSCLFLECFLISGMQFFTSNNRKMHTFNLLIVKGDTFATINRKVRIPRLIIVDLTRKIHEIYRIQLGNKQCLLYFKDHPTNLKGADLLKENRQINQQLCVFTNDILSVFEFWVVLELINNSTTFNAKLKNLNFTTITQLI